ncbi:MAG: competence protein ComK [Bacilli bacterium]|nr:competence protein ComK [Bacilli bacterium]
MKEKIFYIKVENNNEIYVLSNTISKINISWKRYIEELCIENLSTLDGRIKAVKRKYGWIKHTPIYVNNDLVLFYINALKDNNNYFINVKNIVNMEGNDKSTYITFVNNEKIVLNIAYRKIKSYYKKAIILLNKL